MFNFMHIETGFQPNWSNTWRKLVKHTQAIYGQHPRSCLSVFNHFVVFWRFQKIWKWNIWLKLFYLFKINDAQILKAVNCCALQISGQLTMLWEHALGQ